MAALTNPPEVVVARGLAARRPALTTAQRTIAARLERLIAELAPSLAGADVTVAVRDERGRRILDHGPHAALLPASTMKAVTAATVLHVLGPDHRFTTTVAATAPVEDGVLDGDLVIRGGGDPVLSTAAYRTHVYPSRPSTAIEELADAVAATGVQVVRGDLLADASGWSRAQLAAGWRDRYLSEQDARHITQLTVDAGLDVAVDIPTDAPVQVELHPSQDPVDRTAAVFAAALAERGISVRGRVGGSTLPVAATETVAALRSPPVAELLEFTMQRSDNHLADTLLRAAAHAATGDGSWAAAARTADWVLAELGVPSGGLRVADGSGLSRLDRVSAAQLADVDAAMMAGPHAAAWEASLAVAGESGTLRNRLVGSAGQGRFLGKTGTLDDVKAVVGHVRPADADQGLLHVAVIANGVPSGGGWAVTVLMDRLQLELVDALDGCITAYDEQGTPTRTCAGQ